MKKNINKWIFLPGVLITILFSCSKNFITEYPHDSIAAEVAITDEASLQNALTGTYSLLLSTSLFGRDLPIIGDLQADNTYITSSNTGRYLPIYQYTVLRTDGTYGEIFSAAYTGILRANQVINANVSGNNVAQIKAQAYAIRGLLYFELINAYARPYTTADSSAMGVPLVLEYNPTLFPARSSVGTIYNQITSDLTKAFQDGPAYTNSVTISKYAAEALLARAYLFEGDYAKAKTAATDVIQNSGFSLVSIANYRAFWSNGAIQTNQVEVMFEVNADQNQNNSSNDFAGMYENIYGDIFASDTLVGLYHPDDIRLSVIKAGQNKAGFPGYIVDKFPNATNADKDNIKVIRLAEVYLIAAEASYGSGSTADAQTYLNTLMKQRDSTLTYSSTGTQLLNDIVTERRKELAFEGNRFGDVNRLQQNIIRGVNPGALPLSSDLSNPLQIPYTYYMRIGPIPQSEIQANANIASEQNPGY